MKRRDSEQWMHHRLLPQELRERVRRYDQYKWLETRGVDEQSLVQTLPKDLRRDIKRHLCLALVRRVRLLLWLFFFIWLFHILSFCKRGIVLHILISRNIRTNSKGGTKFLLKKIHVYNMSVHNLLRSRNS